MTNPLRWMTHPARVGALDFVVVGADLVRVSTTLGTWQSLVWVFSALVFLYLGVTNLRQALWLVAADLRRRP